MKINIEFGNKQVNKKQYSKVWMTRHQVLAWFWISVYLGIDIYYNHGENVNNIVVLLISSIIATVIPYFAKSYLETKAEKQNEINNTKVEETNEEVG